jgi:hypothetical protein
MNGTRGREETAPSIFAINAELKRVASGGRVFIIDGAAFGNSELFPDQVNPGNFFGDGVLHLEASVYFKERD